MILLICLPNTANNSTAINNNALPIDMRARPTRQKDSRARKVLAPAQPAVGVRRGHRLLAAVLVDERGRRVRHEEARRYAVGEDVSRSQVDGELSDEMDHTCLGGRVGKGSVLADVGQSEAAYGRGHDDAGAILGRGANFEEGKKPEGKLSDFSVGRGGKCENTFE